MTEDHPLRLLRDHLGLTQQALADSLGIVRSYIAQVESRVEPMSKSLGLACCERYALQMEQAGITLEELLLGALVEHDVVKGDDGVTRLVRRHA